MKKSIEYLDHIVALLGKVRTTQAAVIEKATELLFTTFQNGGSIFAFGASHAGIITQELYCRAGGLMVVNPVFNPTLVVNTTPFAVTSAMERLEGFGRIIIDHTALEKDDVIIIHSVSGRNSVTIDMAIRAKEIGAKVIAITNMAYTKDVPSRHSRGKNLYEYGDLVIDNCGEFGDASITVDDSAVKVGPTSTVVGATIANMLVVGFAELCVLNGIEPPVFESANRNKQDLKRSKRLFTECQDRIHYQY